PFPTSIPVPFTARFDSQIISNLIDLSHTKVSQSETQDTDLPPHYPNSWIPVLESRNIRVNEMKTLTVFGQELVAYRSQSGRVSVLDAYCPHLGANIGVGGMAVKECGEECIRCPFHGWTFRVTDGLCVKIPQLNIVIKSKLLYTECEIPTARIKVWQTIELNKTIFVWYHSDSSSPHWDPIEIQEIERNVWRYEGRTEHIINCHFQEIPENGADGQHIQELHTPAVMSGNVLNKSTFYDLLCKVLKHEWESKWWPSATSPHISQMSLNVKNKLFGYTLLEIEFTIRQIGAAFVVLQYKTVDFGGISGAFIQSITPLAPNRNRIVHQIYSEATLWGKLLAKFLLYGE
ncbi:unnamed protein product, partial [Medioppia subpectinata]